MEGSAIDAQPYPQVDYRWFRYSAFALPWLILFLGCCIVLLCLTFWQGNWTINRLRNGVPRFLEPFESEKDGDGGIPRGQRNLRFAAAIAAILAVIIALLAFYLRMKPKTSRIVMILVAVLLIIAAVLSIIAFAIDVGNFEDIRECISQRVGPFTAENPWGVPGARFCEGRPGYGIVLFALDAALAITSIAGFIASILWGKHIVRIRRNPWERARDRALDSQAVADAQGAVVVVPGQATVYKTLMFLLLGLILIIAILLILFSILVHEFRERWFPERSGWSARNSRLRLAAAIGGICLVLISLIPYPHRVLANLLGILFFLWSAIFFTIFGLDIDEVREARDMGGCDGVVSCKYDAFNASIAFDVICGVLALLYAIIQFLALKKKTRVLARDYSPTDDMLPDEFDFNAVRIPGAAPFKTVDAYPVLAPVARPVLGVEVVEVQNPLTGDVSLAVNHVTPASAAFIAGLRVGDYITRWDDMPIRTKADFANAVNDSMIGSTAALQVIRQNPLGVGGTTVDICQLPLRAL